MCPHADPCAQFLLQQVAFIQKEDDLRLGEHLEGAQRLPKHVCVFEPVHPAIFPKTLIKRRDRREENDRVHVVKVWIPVSALS